MIVSIRSQEKFDWSLCYFAAQTYVNLYAQTGDKDYLDDAYDVTCSSINRLISEQRDMNEITW